MTDKKGTWSLGESVLWYSPSVGLDATWSLGESVLLDAKGMAIPYTPYMKDPILDLLSFDLGDALVYKGIINCSTNPNYPAADRGHVYVVSAKGKIGGASGEDVLTGDTLVCKTDSTPSGDQVTVGSEWNIIKNTVVVAAAATEAVAGVVELATNAESLTGTDTTRTITPADLKYVLDNRKATSAEINTGTDDVKFITSDALAGSNIGKKTVEIKVFDYTTNVATGDGKAYFVVPDELNGMKLVRVAATVITAGTTNSTTMQIHNVTDNVDMLSTVMSIESGETSTRTSASPGVIDTAHDDVDTGDVLRFDVDTVASIAPQGLIWEMSFQLP